MLARAIAEYWPFLLLATAMLAWRIWGHDVSAHMRRIEKEKQAALLQSLYDRANPNSHFRQTVEQINEDTPPVMAGPDKPGTFAWSGASYGSRAEAEAARWHHVLSEARDFYKDLDHALGNRIARGPASDTIDGSRR